MGQGLMIGEFLHLARRRWLLVVGIVALGTAAAGLFALQRPSLYESAAKVLIESQQIPDALARSTVTLSTAARLQTIEQRLMARDTVAALVDRLNLFSDLPLPMTRKVDLLRDSTVIESIATSGGTPWNADGGVVAFTITVTLGDADQAALLANELAHAAIAQNLEARFDRARDTLAYFEDEERSTAAALAAAEAELSEFRKVHEGALPEDLEPGRATLAQLHASETDLDRQILDLELRRTQLEAMLDGAPGSGIPASALQVELQRLELELATRRRVLASNHPELRRLQEQRDAVRALAAGEVSGASDGVDGRRATPVQSQIDQLNGDIAQMRARRKALGQERARVEASLVRDPAVEASLQAIDRRVDQLRERYADVARRQAEARTGAQLETNQQSERFEILEAALVPEEPIGPNRLKLLVFGVAASAALAGGLVFLLEMLRPSLRTARQMEARLEIRPVVSIPYVAVPGERRRRLALWGGGVAIAALALWLALPLVEQLAPVEALKLRLEQRLSAARGTISG